MSLDIMFASFHRYRIEHFDLSKGMTTAVLKKALIVICKTLPNAGFIYRLKCLNLEHIFRDVSAVFDVVVVVVVVVVVSVCSEFDRNTVGGAWMTRIVLLSTRCPVVSQDSERERENSPCCVRE